MRRIVILGGGIAGLTTAYELTSTPELRSKYKVEVYQLGHRLGGKLASGRLGPEAKIVENGLHVWFGFYENAFSLLQGVYSEWEKDPRSAFQSWTDVIAPRRYTPIGYEDNGHWDLYPQLWPVNSQVPGSGSVELTLSAVLQQIFARLDNATWLEKALRKVKSGLEKLAGSDSGSPALALVERLKQWLPVLLREVPGPLGAQTGQVVRWFLAQLSGIIHEALDEKREAPAQERVDLLFADYVLTVLRGLLNPRYGILDGQSIEVLNEYEFTTWLLENGASRELLDSPFVRVVYETLLQYQDGDPAQPNVEAGTAVNWGLRMLTYKGSMIWEVLGGMGDVLVAPLYQVLRQRGVTFHFFHKVQALHLSEDQRAVENVDIGVQATTRGEYQPLLFVDHTPAWPAEPLWDQLVDGERLGRAHTDFESKWCQEPFASRKQLRRGVDFDDLVLAIPLGAFKPLNEEPSPCDALMRANPRFALMVDKLALAPTQTMQLWFDYSLAQLGFDCRKAGFESELPAMVNGPRPFDIWGDMTPVIAREQWRGNRPLSVQYLCGMLHTELYRRPAADANVPGEAAALVRENARAWLERYAGLLWPRACLPGTWTLDWQALHAPDEQQGLARLDAQFLKANVDPAMCVVATFVGTSRYRLAPDESGFENLVLAGSWTRTPLQLECVEGAVMSGRAAARALGAFSRTIPGENWLRIGQTSGRAAAAARSAAQ